MKQHQPEKILISFDLGPKVEALGSRYKKYTVEFIDKSTGNVIFKDKINNNMWTKCNKRYNIPWEIKINNKVYHTFDLTDKEVKVSFESKSVGDTIAWMPQVLEFQKYYNCKVTVSTFHNEWFEGLPEYGNIKFIKPGETGNFYAHYQLGWFRNDKDKWDEGSYHPTQPNLVPLGQCASDILGIPYKEVNYGVNFKPKERPLPDKYICIGPRSTAGLKEWPHHYWEHLAKLLSNIGYKVVNVSYEGFSCPNVIDRKELNWEDTYNYLYHAELFIGLGSGLSWFNWVMNKQIVMINNFIPFGYEMTHNTKKIEDYSVCNNCWVDPRVTFNKGDWNWCPRHQNTPAQHICHKAIRPEKVFKEIQQILKFK